MTPPPPGRLTIRTCCPYRWVRRSARIRAMTSGPAPGPTDTMMDTGLSGYWAECRGPHRAIKKSNATPDIIPIVAPRPTALRRSAARAAGRPAKERATGCMTRDGMDESRSPHPSPVRGGRLRAKRSAAKAKRGAGWGGGRDAMKQGPHPAAFGGHPPPAGEGCGLRDPALRPESFIACIRLRRGSRRCAGRAWAGRSRCAVRRGRR
jgi:hypothetical protein